MIASPRPIEDPARRHGVALAVALILLVSTALRLWQLSTPAEMMFDEIYYAKDAKAVVDGRVGPKEPLRWAGGDEVSWPHPEMGKFAIAAGILLFGDRAFGWRLPAVVAGVALLACVYPLGRRLGLSPPWALIALLFAAADPLGITQSRIATLDIFIAVWTVLCVLMALRYVQDGWHARWLFLCGAAGGMALATKWSGALAIIAAVLIILVSWVMQARAARHEAAHTAHAAGRAPEPGGAAAPSTTCGESMPATPPQGSVAGRVLTVLAALVAVPLGVYLLSYVQYFATGHTLADFRELHRQMMTFNLNLKATHTYASAAYTWIVDYRPVWYFFEGKATYRGVIAIGNPFLWWLATLSLVAAVVLALLRRSYALLPAAALVVVLYLPWMATTRTSFLYYMTPVAPFMAILLAGALCLFAGGVIPRRGWLAVAGTALATAVLWRPVGLAAAWLFWTQPRRASDTLGWVGLAVGVLVALAVLLILLSPRLRPYRPWMSMVVAGAVIGIVVAFIPIVLGLPISPEYFSQITWFPSWI
jgi:dolichyl-phosphate-mannose--protein O-mannosyl transferase